MLTQSNFSKCCFPTIYSPGKPFSINHIHAASEHSCCSTWRALHFPLLNSSPSQVLSVPLFLCIPITFGCNFTGWFKHSPSCVTYPCTCPSPPDHKLPVGRHSLSHFGSPLCSSSDLAFSSVTDSNMNMPAVDTVPSIKSHTTFPVHPQLHPGDTYSHP